MPNPSSWKGLGAISTIAKYTLLSYIALYFAMVENGAQSSSRRWIWHPISLCDKFFSRRWNWHPIPLYDTILYSIDMYYTIIRSAWRWHPIPFKKMDLASNLTIDNIYPSKTCLQKMTLYWHFVSHRRGMRFSSDKCMQLMTHCHMFLHFQRVFDSGCLELEAADLHRI